MGEAVAGFERAESQLWKKSYCGENAVKTAFHAVEKIVHERKSVRAADFIFVHNILYALGNKKIHVTHFTVIFALV